MIYKKETYVDMTKGEVDVFESIYADKKETLYVAKGSIATPQGAVPISAEVKDVSSVEDAFEKFEEVLQARVDEIIEEAQKAHLEESKRIVTPDEIRGEGKGPQLSIVK